MWRQITSRSLHHITIRYITFPALQNIQNALKEAGVEDSIKAIAPQWQMNVNHTWYDYKIHLLSKFVRVLVAISTWYDYKIWQMNVNHTFLNGEFKENIHILQLEGFMSIESNQNIFKPQLSIYGLKQVFRSWNIRFDNIIKHFMLMNSYLLEIMYGYCHQLKRDYPHNFR